MIKVKTPTQRKAILFARVKPSNLVWMHAQAEACGFSSFSSFIDTWIDDQKAIEKAIKLTKKAKKLPRGRNKK